MSGAVIVPDLSANQVAIRVLKQFIAINGFTKSVIQCDDHSNFINFQEPIGRKLPLLTQVSPPSCHQNQNTIERFHETLYGQVRSTRIGLADHLGIRSNQVDGSFPPWFIQRAAYQINRYLIRSDGKTSI